MTGRPAAAIGAAALAVAAAACSASRIEGGTFHSAKGYAVTLPADGWRVAPGGRADLTLRRDSPPGGMVVDATCDGEERGRALPVLTRHLTFGLTRRETVERDARTVAGRPAEHLIVRGVADGADVEVETLVVQGERCVHDFLYVAPVDQFESGRPAFQALVESFAGEPR